MSLEFPRAWQLARAAAPDAHHPGCSYVQTGRALLCDLDCPVIADSPEFHCDALHGRDGVVSGLSDAACSGHDSPEMAAYQAASNELRDITGD